MTAVQTVPHFGPSCPPIVVVGDQSHGKFSLLEALSGVKLPKGEGMKTRMPLVMQLRCLPDGEEEYAQISAEGW